MKLAVGHLKYSVAFLPEVGGGELDGRTVFNPPRIEVCSELAPSERLATLLHELVHAIVHGYGQGHKKRWSEEEMAELVGSGLAALLVNNESELLPFIAAACREHARS